MSDKRESANCHCLRRLLGRVEVRGSTCKGPVYTWPSVGRTLAVRTCGSLLYWLPLSSLFMKGIFLWLFESMSISTYKPVKSYFLHEYSSQEQTLACDEQTTESTGLGPEPVLADAFTRFIAGRPEIIEVST